MSRLKRRELNVGKQSSKRMAGSRAFSAKQCNSYGKQIKSRNVTRFKRRGLDVDECGSTVPVACEVAVFVVPSKASKP